MAGNLTPDTNIALLKAAQNDTAQRMSFLKNASKVSDKTSEKSLEKVTEAAQEFEAVFIAEMMKPMFEGISTEAPFGGGKGEEIFRGMLLQEYGKILSQTGNVGISSQVREEMIRMQEKADKGAVEQ